MPVLTTTASLIFENYLFGRGTDIVLSGNWQAEVEKIKNPVEAQIEKINAERKESHDAMLASCGLHIIGTQRHEPSRLDNRLRGRSGC